MHEDIRRRERKKTILVKIMPQNVNLSLIPPACLVPPDREREEGQKIGVSVWGREGERERAWERE